MTSYESQQPSRQIGDTSSKIDTFLRWSFQAAVVLIAFTAGSIFTTADLFPGTQIGDAYKGGLALYERTRVSHDVFASDLWEPERTSQRGVTVNEPALAQPGVTLYTDGQSGNARIIDAAGHVLHEWRQPFSEVWTPDSGIKRPVPDAHVHFRKPIVYPNGDLVTVYEGSGDTPYGYGIVKLDRNSNVIWTYFGRAHHDLDVGPDGRVYAITQEIVNKRSDPQFTNLAKSRLLDSLVILSPDGEELKEIPLFEVVANSRYRHLIHTVSAYSVADPLHANDLNVITEEMARNFPFGKPGQVLISFRELNAIGVIDPDTERLVWATRGPWLGQHDPDILPNGNILLFDNYGDYGDWRTASRVLEVNPRTLRIVWQYGGTPGHPLGSLIRGSQQRLKNGNTLIVESSGGRMVEVTRSGEIAWEFVHPVRDGRPGQGPMLPVITNAERLDPMNLDPGVLSPPRLSQAIQ